MHKRNTALELSIKKILEGLNMFDSANHTLTSDVDQENRGLFRMKDP